MQGFDGAGRDVESVVKTIIALGRELHIWVMVEGVETARQAEFLLNTRTDQIQEFLFGCPAKDVAPFVAKSLLQVSALAWRCRGRLQLQLVRLSEDGAACRSDVRKASEARSGRLPPAPTAEPDTC